MAVKQIHMVHKNLNKRFGRWPRRIFHRDRDHAAHYFATY